MGWPDCSPRCSGCSSRIWLKSGSVFSISQNKRESLTQHMLWPECSSSPDLSSHWEMGTCWATYVCPPSFCHLSRESALKVNVLVTQSCPSLCDPMDCSPPGPSVRGILQARILEWVAISFCRGSSRPRDQTHVFYMSGRFSTPEPFCFGSSRNIMTVKQSPFKSEHI